MFSGLVTSFLPRSKHPLISWLQSPSTEILEPKKIKSVTVSTFHYFPTYLLLFPPFPHLSGKIMGWIKHKLESRLPGEISIISPQVFKLHHLYGQKQRGTKESLDEKSKEVSEKAGFELNIQ